MPWTITREHEICCGHRVAGHEGKCKDLHGHNYKFVMTLAPKNGLDPIGRVIDFNAIKLYLCDWLERNWDHKTLLWKEDPLYLELMKKFSQHIRLDSIIGLPCNPTVENIAEYFVEDIAPVLLGHTDVRLVSLVLWETGKCFTTYVAKEPNETDETVRDVERLESTSEKE